MQYCLRPQISGVNSIYRGGRKKSYCKRLYFESTISDFLYIFLQCFTKGLHLYHAKFHISSLKTRIFANEKARGDKKSKFQLYVKLVQDHLLPDHRRLIEDLFLCKKRLQGTPTISYRLFWKTIIVLFLTINGLLSQQI